MIQLNNMIYLPIEDFNINSCYVIYSEDIIRAYNEMPENDKEVSYTDYYINTHYMENNGTQFFTLEETLPICLQKERLTNYYTYRNDLADILIISSIFIAFVWFLTFSLIKVTFKGRKIF